jgi:hypothetical protein
VWTFQVYEHIIDYSTFLLNLPFFRLDMVQVGLTPAHRSIPQHSTAHQVTAQHGTGYGQHCVLSTALACSLLTGHLLNLRCLTDYSTLAAVASKGG